MLYLTRKKETKQTICFYLLLGTTSKKDRGNSKAAKTASKATLLQTAEVVTVLLIDKYYIIL